MYAIRRKNSAFSLIELVIVVVIIGIIAAIAIPRMSRGAQGANDSTLIGNLAILRKSLDLYAAEHGGTFPAVANLATQLTSKTNADGTTTGTPIYGPYIRAIPALNVGAAKGQNGFVATAGGTTAGWVYDSTAGTIIPNTTSTEVDQSGNKYNAY
jgi:prepilin-type N-terminal cleavage/methylation domain-containing protein